MARRSLLIRRPAGAVYLTRSDTGGFDRNGVSNFPPRSLARRCRGSWLRAGWRFYVSGVDRSLTVAVPRFRGLVIDFGAASVSERETTSGLDALTSRPVPSQDAGVCAMQ